MMKVEGIMTFNSIAAVDLIVYLFNISYVKFVFPRKENIMDKL